MKAISVKFESPINRYLNVNKNASFPASGVEILPSLQSKKEVGQIILFRTYAGNHFIPGSLIAQWVEHWHLH